MMLDEDRAAHFASIALGHVTREYPHVLSHVLDGPADARTPRDLHPVFHGSFDWHSCVHGYWLLATLLRRFPDLPSAGAIGVLFDERLAPGPIGGECAYFARPASRGFERPYGWAWVVALQHALAGTAWAEALQPLTAIIVARFKGFLPASRYPVRVGTHFNTAFALTLIAPYAAANDPALSTLAQDKAAEWYGADAGCQAWEPGQDDFLSSALMEAACMRHLLPDGQFVPWFDRFLPEVGMLQPATLFEPASVSDRSDGKIAHLDGLNLSRAWCWREIAAALPNGDARRAIVEQAANRHLAASLPQVAENYMGEHWLASFAVLALWPDALRPPA